MWADHAEVSKATLRAAIALLELGDPESDPKGNKNAS
jgi:hypothetical protein